MWTHKRTSRHLSLSPRNDIKRNQYLLFRLRPVVHLQHVDPRGILVCPEDGRPPRIDRQRRDIFDTLPRQQWENDSIRVVQVDCRDGGRRGEHEGLVDS